MPAAPSIENYYIGKGRVFWTPEAGVERDLGNVPEFEFRPELEKLAHYSSRSGVRTKDREVVIEKSATLRIVMEEWSLENLRMALMGGTAADDGSGNMRFDLLAESEVRGAIRFEGANSVGPQIDIALPLVAFTPALSITPIGDEWGGLEMTGEVLAVAGSFGTIIAFQDLLHRAAFAREIGFSLVSTCSARQNRDRQRKQAACQRT